MYGGFGIESSGVAPRLLRSVRNCSTFARYCPLFAVQGVGVWAPASSLSAIVGVGQPVTETA